MTVAIATTLLTLGSGDLYEALRGVVHRKPGPLADQINQVISDADSAGLRLVGPIRLIQFRSGGSPSRVMVLRPKDPDSDDSDELRIYDLTADRRVDLTFSFRPTAPRSSSTSQDQSTRGQVQPLIGKPLSFAISIRAARDLDGAPGNELLVDLSEFAVQPIWPRPTYLSWNPADRRFELSPLLGPVTTGRTTMRGLVAGRYSPSSAYTKAVIHQVYLQPTLIDDDVGRNSSFLAFAVEAYVAKPERIDDPRGRIRGGLALTAGYVVRRTSYTTPDLLQVVRWHLNLRTRPFTANAATYPVRVIHVGDQASHLRALLTRSTDN